MNLNQPISVAHHPLYKACSARRRQYAEVLQTVNMATVEVNVLEAGIEIREVNKERQITLSKDAWESLCACKVQLSNALSDDVETQFDLDENIKAHTSKYNDNIYLHIRSWWNGFPTKTGVSLRKLDWEQLEHHLKQGPDMKLGVKVLHSLISKFVGDYMRVDCEGCLKDWPSQTDHACLMNTQQLAAAAVEKATNNLCPAQFISALANEAYKEKIVLDSRPFQLLKKLQLFHMDDIKKEILSCY